MTITTLQKTIVAGATVPKATRAPRYKKALKKRLLARAQGCTICGGGVVGGSRHEPILELHHIIPRCQGGDNDVANLVVVCRPCHVLIHQEGG